MRYKVEGFRHNGERCFFAENLDYETSSNLMKSVKWAMCVKTPYEESYVQINKENHDGVTSYMGPNTVNSASTKTTLETAFEQLDCKIAEITAFLNAEKEKIARLQKLSEDRRSGIERRDYRTRGKK